MVTYSNVTLYQDASVCNFIPYPRFISTTHCLNVKQNVHQCNTHTYSKRQILQPLFSHTMIYKFSQFGLLSLKWPSFWTKHKNASWAKFAIPTWCETSSNLYSCDATAKLPFMRYHAYKAVAIWQTPLGLPVLFIISLNLSHLSPIIQIVPLATTE